MTFDAFVTNYLDSMRQTQRRSEKTIEAYSRDLKQAVAFFGEYADIQSLDTLSVIGWVRALSVKNIAGRSICRKLSALRGLFQEAVNQKIIQINPAANVRAPKAVKYLPNTLSPDAVQRLLDAPLNMGDLEAIRDQAIFELLYSSGLRLAEVLRLTLQDVLGNPEELKILGKGSKERVVPVGGPSGNGHVWSGEQRGGEERAAGICLDPAEYRKDHADRRRLCVERNRPLLERGRDHESHLVQRRHRVPTETVQNYTIRRHGRPEDGYFRRSTICELFGRRSPGRLSQRFRHSIFGDFSRPGLQRRHGRVHL